MTTIQTIIIAAGFIGLIISIVMLGAEISHQRIEREEFTKMRNRLKLSETALRFAIAANQPKGVPVVIWDINYPEYQKRMSGIAGYNLADLLSGKTPEKTETTNKRKNMSAEFDSLEEQVKKNIDVEDSALALINGFAARLEAAGTDPAKLAALRADLKANADDLAAAVVANTPAA